MSLDFLLEIGTEEIPHWMIPSALKQLAEKLDLFGVIPNVDATPRRLVVRASGLPARTPDQEQIVKGPPVSAGEKAAAGFAKKQGVDLSAMTKVGDYFELRKQIPGRATIDILAEAIPPAVLGIQWPKTMYWTGKSGPRFIRPIRWIVALLGNQVIPFEIASVKSGSTTKGHRQLGSKAISVTTTTYESELRKNFVILSSDERRTKIQTEISALGAKPDADLLETLTFITEYPTAIKGDFDPSYLSLPAEVLTTVMRHHQKYFSVESTPGVLANHFVAVMNTSGDPEGLVKKGNERVLRARFNDAKFFWDVDQHKLLADRVDALANVTFQAKLGSYLDKTKRVLELVKQIGGSESAQRAAWLAKADLTTDMVKEFTDLQGIVGGLYAKFQGESKEVADAIYDHYKPLSMEDSIPSTLDGQMLALADKLDTLSECFRVGMAPTGSKDPFALRRAAQGIIKILAVGQMNVRLDELASGELLEFMVDRVHFYFREHLAFKYDEVKAVLAAGYSTVADVQSRLEALSRVRPTPDFEPLAASFKRISDVLKQAEFVPVKNVDASLFDDDAERELSRQFNSVRAQLGKTKDYVARLEAIATLRPALDHFFDTVLVNAKDESVRANRLTLLHNLLTEFSTIADFSEIVTSNQTTHNADTAVRSGEQK